MKPEQQEKPVWGAPAIGALIGVTGQAVRNWVKDKAPEAARIYVTASRRLYVYPSEFCQHFRQGRRVNDDQD